MDFDLFSLTGRAWRQCITFEYISAHSVSSKTSPPRPVMLLSPCARATSSAGWLADSSQRLGAEAARGRTRAARTAGVPVYPLRVGQQHWEPHQDCPLLCARVAVLPVV